ncbi:MAG: metallopeptidase family protein [Elusimicrobia bacterium]|nr:metallopeptidase family protein [Elusimicrobiota bacterium]
MQEFETIIEESVNKLPQEFKDILEAKQIGIIAREQPPQPIQEKFQGQTVFGVFIGVPYGRFSHVQLEPTRIELYKNSFEKTFSNIAEIKQEIQRAVMHEIAHYFGFSESKIRSIGY